MLAVNSEMVYSTFPGGASMREMDLSTAEDWDVVTSLLPDGWRENARKLKAYQRVRSFKGPDELLRTLLIHIGEGCSLRETAARVKEGGIAEVSDPAILKRVRRASHWLQWMALGVMEKWFSQGRPSLSDGPKRVRIVDGTNIQEPTSKGTSWRIHYSIELSSLLCNEVNVTGPEIGESFCRFVVEPGDLMIGDRGYAHKKGVYHVVSDGGDVLVRTSLSSMGFQDPQGNTFDLLEHLRSLRFQRIEDWPVVISYQEHEIMGRICAIRKSETAAKKARKQIIRDYKRRGKARQPKPETLEAAGYTFVFTTLDQSISAQMILKIYSTRWQVELAFKRLKSLLGMGRLHMMRQESVRAWIHGKLLLAFLVEALVVAAHFFPWGYPIESDTWQETIKMEGNATHASFPDAGHQPSQTTTPETEGLGKPS
jgi:hypothetical protein